MALFEFNANQMAAWDWITSAEDNEISSADALALYRSEGGHISTTDWYRARNIYIAGIENLQQLYRFAENETLPENMWIQSPRAFAKDYVASVQFQLRNTSTGEVVNTFRYIEADYRMSLSEINNNLELLGLDYLEEEQWTVNYVQGYKLYRRGAITG